MRYSIPFLCRILSFLNCAARRGNIGHFICRTTKATPTIRGGRSRLPFGHDLLVERQQHNQNKAQRKKRRAAAEAKCHRDRLESAAYMRRAYAEAKAMAIGNIADVLRLKTVSPIQSPGSARTM